MTGGLLNLVSYGNLNIIVNGNPKKNFFTATYKKYTNFGLQKRIISCNVTNRRLRENNLSTFDFNIPRWGDLITDTFFRIQMPHIWSPVFVEPSDIFDSPGGVRGLWASDGGNTTSGAGDVQPEYVGTDEMGVFAPGPGTEYPPKPFFLADKQAIIPRNVPWPSDYARDQSVLPINWLDCNLQAPFPAPPGTQCVPPLPALRDGPSGGLPNAPPPFTWGLPKDEILTPISTITFETKTCDGTECTPQTNVIYNPNNGLKGYIKSCGELLAENDGIENIKTGIIVTQPCVAGNKVVGGLYNINDISGTANFFPRQLGWAHSPYVESFEFKWIENLGSQLMKNVTLSAGGLIIQQFSGDYLMNMVNRDYSYEKKELFNEMTGNIKEMYDPAYAGKRKGLYPNSLFGAPLMNTVFMPTSMSPPFKRWLKPSIYQYRVYENVEDIISSDYQLRTNLNPSIFKRSLCIPLNLYYMFSSTQAFPLISMIHNELRISIECRPIRELFVVRDIRQWIRTYYSHNFNLGEVTKNGSGKSIYEALDSNYYNNGGKFFSQKNIFVSQVRAPYISTINTVDPLYQMYMFTSQYAAQNQQYVKQAVLGKEPTARIQEDLREQGIWEANPELVCTFVYLDHEEQQVFRQRPQSYLITQIQEYIFQKKHHKEFTIDRFKSNSLVKNWMWYQIRSDTTLRNEWSNYTNWTYSTYYPYTMQPMYHTELSMNWFNPTLPLNEQINPVWETKTLNYANPNAKANFLPAFGQYITLVTEPGNYRVNNYIKQIPRGLIDEYAWLPYINDNGIYPGAVSIWSDMDKQPPYFPYSYKKTDLSFNSAFQYKNGINPYITGPLRQQNKKDIFKKWGLILDGKIREDSLDADYYNLVEPFVRSSGKTNDGLYTYNFGLNGSQFILDPQGAMNLLNYKHIEFEYSSINTAPYDDISLVAILPLCLPETETSDARVYGYNKVEWQVYEYQFNLKVMEEQYNYLTISNGLASLKYQSAI